MVGGRGYRQVLNQHLLLRYLIIDDEIKMSMDEDYVSRMAFWDSIF